MAKNNSVSENAVIYARFSSYNQREESIEQQVTECKEYAATHGLEIIDIYADEAISAKISGTRADRRPQFQRLRRDAEKKRFSVILAYKSNRIYRNMLHALVFEEEVSKFGIKVLYAKEEFGDNAAGRFALRTMMNVNQFYSENMAEDIRRNQAANAAICKANGPASYGYKAGEDGKFVLDEDAAPVVLEIFTRVAAGEPFIQIANDFNLRGIRTRQGNFWGKSSFQTIIKNERYTGVYIFNDVRIPGGMPEIISRELFERVQKMLKNKKNPQGRRRENDEYLLTGKLYCGECNSHMVGMSGTGRNGEKHYYYVCNSRHLGNGCKKEYERRDFVEEKIAEVMRNKLLDADFIEWIANMVDEYQKKHGNSAEIKTLTERISSLDKSIKNTLNAIDQGLINETIKTHLMELEKEHSDLSSKLAVARSKKFYVTREQVVAWLKSFRDGDIKSKSFQKRIFSAFLLKAYIYDDRHVRLILDLVGDKNRTIDFDLSEDFSGEIDGSYNLSSGSPAKAPLLVNKRGAFERCVPLTRNVMCPSGVMFGSAK